MWTAVLYFAEHYGENQFARQNVIFSAVCLPYLSSTRHAMCSPYDDDETFSRGTITVSAETRGVSDVEENKNDVLNTSTRNAIKCLYRTLARTKKSIFVLSTFTLRRFKVYQSPYIRFFSGGFLWLLFILVRLLYIFPSLYTFLGFRL